MNFLVVVVVVGFSGGLKVDCWFESQVKGENGSEKLSLRKSC